MNVKQFPLKEKAISYEIQRFSKLIAKSFEQAGFKIDVIQLQVEVINAYNQGKHTVNEACEIGLGKSLDLLFTAKAGKKKAHG